MPDDHAPAGIGHNSSAILNWPPAPGDVQTWLSAMLADRIEQRDRLHGGIQRFLAAHPVERNKRGDITSVADMDDETVGKAADFVKLQLIKFRDGLDAKRETEARPFIDSKREFDAWFKDAAKPIVDGIAEIKARCGFYAEAKEAAERRAREEAAAEARRIADEAAAKAAAEADIEAIDTAIAATEQADRAEARVAAPAADLSRVRGDYGATFSLATTWDFEVVDMFEFLRAILAGKVPVDCVEIVAPKVRALIKGGKRRDTPGLNVFEKKAIR